MLFGVVVISILLLSRPRATPAGQVQPAPPAVNAAASKNIILLICDGSGYNHVDAASMYQAGSSGGQAYHGFPATYGMSTSSADGHGYDPQQAWDRFHYVISGYTDSAAAATAMSGGVKTHNGAIGLDRNQNPVKHVLELAEEQGKATGVVTTMAVSHATPAGFVAHNLSRYNFDQIAREMILSSAVDVIMGSGHPWFDNDGRPAQTALSYRYVGGQALWDELEEGNAGGDCDGDGLSDPWQLVQTRAGFQALSGGAAPKRVLGIAPAHDTLQQLRTDQRGSYPYGAPSPYKDDAPYFVPRTETVPTLAEMTAAALNVLDDDPDGFLLMVEGGAVDYAAHANESGRMMEEQLDFDRAVGAAIAWVEANGGWSDTLLIVTADHETGYLTGPGSDPGWEPLVSKGAGNLPGMEWHSDSHTNQLVPLYAKGFGTALLDRYADEHDPVRGRYLDNTELAHVMFACLAKHHTLYLPAIERQATGLAAVLDP